MARVPYGDGGSSTPGTAVDLDTATADGVSAAYARSDHKHKVTAVRSVVISATPPTAGQVLTASSRVAAAFADPAAVAPTKQRVTSTTLLVATPYRIVELALASSAIITLPEAPSDLDQIWISDVLGNIPASYTCSIVPSAGHTIVGKTTLDFVDAYMGAILRFHATDSLWSLY